ncbi:MAG TPA: DNA repair protein RecN [Gemmatimonadaceae bacterium]|nr:DNA repair protein RecN [Gemmatimonadaceae bacterium]
MLTELRIRNLAVIESVTLPVAPGFNVLSGETGAGKSIIVGALGLLLGERGSSDVVRSGADRAVVEGVFDGSGNTALAHILDERGIETEDGLLVLRREVAAGGKSRAWVNDVTVTTGALASIGRLLVNLHGQHESQALLNEDAQRDVLDALAGATDIAASVRDAHAEVESIRASIADLTRRRDEASKRADYLRHLAREIDEARLIPGEEERLDDEARRLTHAVELRGHIAQALAAIEDGDDAAIHSLGIARRAVQSAAKLDPAASGLSDTLDQALVTLQELARDLAAYDATLDSDPERLADVDRRRDQISRVTRKHGGSVESALAALRDARAELDVLDTAAVDLRGLTSRADAAQSALTEKAARLTKLRQKASRKLAAEVEALLPDLGLPGGKFIVHLEPLDAVASSGAERVEFRVALNVGHDARPLARTASGGELSRVMLALKTILARLDHIPTLVFDEVDAGIGGTVALKVGDSLRRLAEHHQVVVITHLAQVAARAHHHVVVAKGSKSGVSTADISIVLRDDRVTEVARMLGGDPSSKVSRAHARELLEAAG